MKTMEQIYKEVLGHEPKTDGFERGTFTWTDIKALMEAAQVAKNLHKPLVSGSLLADAWKELSEFQDAAGFKSSAIAEVLASNDR